jgi:glucose-6-phosphate 3-dehydrogenase
MKFLICGMGLIGKQRLQAILDSKLAQQIYIYDPYLESLPASYVGQVSGLTEIPPPDEIQFTHVVIATPHDQSLKILEKVVIHKPRILMEKPMGRNLIETEKIVNLTKACDLSVGFNYRFMEGIEKLKKILSQDELGEINSVRIDLGHGGSPEDAASWKLNKESAGGGSLLDPGIHLIDLIMFLFNKKSDAIEIDGANYWSGFWNTGIEESSMVIGKVGKIPFNVISSTVAWRTRFVIEVIGSNGYVTVTGRGRSDGPQRITIGRRWGWQHAKSQLESEESAIVMIKDTSISKETIAWLNKSKQVCSLAEGFETMKFYEKILSRKRPDEL